MILFRFFTEVNNFNFEKEAKYNKPAFVVTDYVVRETDVQNALQTNVLFNLNVVEPVDGAIALAPGRENHHDIDGADVEAFICQIC